MHENPQLAILQHSSGVLQVGAAGFERCMTYFTRTIYTAMEWAVASGDDAPFLGHNAFIRWTSLRELSYTDNDGEEKWWSESHVSEDFDLSIRLHVKGYVVRLATYHEGGFKEGVSFHIYDEIARWQKYIYGCNEIVFYPLRFWLFRGPLTIGFRYFLWSNLLITSKLSIIAYLCNYYAIASAFPLAIVNYFIIGWVKHVDKFYISSWRVFIGVLVVFNGLAPLGISMVKHRYGEDKFLGSMVEAMKWSPFFALFFMGLSYHLCEVVLCHFLGLDVEWGATTKEYYGRRMGLSKILYDFKNLYIFLLVLIGGMIYLGLYAPSYWRVTNVEAVGPLALQVGCHFLLPACSFFI
jgi:membrane glycosyltransferase